MGSPRPTNFAWVVIVAVLVFLLQTFFGRNIETVMERLGWHKMLDDLLVSYPETVASMVEYLPSGFWAGVFASLAVWGGFEVVYAWRRRKGNGEKTALPPRPDTRLRLKLDPSGSGQYLQESQSNVHAWQQTSFFVDGHKTDGSTVRWTDADTLSLTFEAPVAYERPIVETFGHAISGYNFYALGDHGAVFQFVEKMRAPALEIWFPPIGYYAEKQALGQPNTNRPTSDVSAKEPIPAQPLKLDDPDAVQVLSDVRRLARMLGSFGDPKSEGPGIIALMDRVDGSNHVAWLNPKGEQARIDFLHWCRVAKYDRDHYGPAFREMKEREDILECFRL